MATGKHGCKNLSHTCKTTGKKHGCKGIWDQSTSLDQWGLVVTRNKVTCLETQFDKIVVVSS